MGYPVEKNEEAYICQTEAAWQAINATSDIAGEYYDEDTQIEYKAYCADAVIKAIQSITLFAMIAIIYN